MNFFKPQPAILPLLQRIDSLTHEASMHVCAVGGTVRDALLRRAVRDIDIAVQGDALAFARLLADALDGSFVLLDEENFVARVVLGDGDVDYVDVAALHGALEDDLRRRDFTINAIAAPVTGGEVFDPTGGVPDLSSKVVRVVAPGAFAADPLRMLRAVRIADELEFAIEPATERGIRATSWMLADVSAERVRDELAHILALARTEPALRQLDGLGLLDVMIPELAAGRGVSQPPNHHSYDVFEHAIHAVEAIDALLAERKPSPESTAWVAQAFWRAFAWCEDELRGYLAEPMREGRSRGALLKLATLLHDVAKPATRTVDAEGRVRFFGHADEGARMAMAIMRRLRFSAHECAFVATLVAEHLRPVQLAAVGEVPTRRALYRFHRDVGDGVAAVIMLALADAAGSLGPRLTTEKWARHVAYMNSLLVRLRETEAIVSAPRVLSGHDIMAELGVGQGPIIGRLLEELREAQAAGEVEGREAALAFVRKRASG